MTLSSPVAAPPVRPPPSWVPIRQMHARFDANIAALATRYPQLAEDLQSHAPAIPHFILPGANGISFGAQAAGRIKPLPTVLPAAGAIEMTRKCFPQGSCDRGIAVVGEDQGWLWNGLYRLPCATPGAPGHRSPLFF